MSILKGLKYQGFTVAWSVVILILCTMRMSPSEDGHKFFFEGFDKIVHLGIFYVFVVLILHGKKWQLKVEDAKWATAIKTLVLAAIFGGFIEFIQWKFFTYRSAEWWDFTCDMTGACMAVFAYLLLPLKK